MTAVTAWPECDDCDATAPRGGWGGAIVPAGWETRQRPFPQGEGCVYRWVWICPDCCQIEDNGP